MAKTEKPKPQTGSGEGNVSRPVVPAITLPEPDKKRWMLVIAILSFIFLFPVTSSAKLSMLYIAADNKKFSGRASGNVYNRNGTIRGMAFFATVLNAFTSAAKAVFAFFNSNWRALTDGQRATWIGYETFVSNRFAQSISVKGKTAYVQLNVNIANAGGTAIVNAPSKLIAAPSYIALTSVTADASAGTVSIAYVVNATGDTCFIYATKPLSPGISSPSESAFRLVSIGDFSAASPLAFGADYVARFGNITSQAGAKIFIRVVNVDDATGLTSIANEVSTTIVA